MTLWWKGIARLLFVVLLTHRALSQEEDCQLCADGTNIRDFDAVVNATSGETCWSMFSKATAHSSTQDACVTLQSSFREPCCIAYADRCKLCDADSFLRESDTLVLNDTATCGKMNNEAYKLHQNDALCTLLQTASSACCIANNAKCDFCGPDADIRDRSAIANLTTGDKCRHVLSETANLADTDSQCLALQSSYNATCCIEYNDRCRLCQEGESIRDSNAIADPQTNETCSEKSSASYVLNKSQDECRVLQSNFTGVCCIASEARCDLCGSGRTIRDSDAIGDFVTNETCGSLSLKSYRLSFEESEDECLALQSSYSTTCCIGSNDRCRLCGSTKSVRDNNAIADLQTNKTCSDISREAYLLDQKHSQCSVLQASFRETCCIESGDRCTLCVPGESSLVNNKIADSQTNETCGAISSAQAFILASSQDQCLNLQANYRDTCCIENNVICDLCGSERSIRDRYAIVDSVTKETCSDKSWDARMFETTQDQCLSLVSNYSDFCCINDDERCDFCGEGSSLLDYNAIANFQTNETCSDMSSDARKLHQSLDQCLELKANFSSACCIDYDERCDFCGKGSTILDHSAIANFQTNETCSDISSSAWTLHRSGGQCLELKANFSLACCIEYVDRCSLCGSGATIRDYSKIADLETNETCRDVSDYASVLELRSDQCLELLSNFSDTCCVGKSEKCQLCGPGSEIRDRMAIADPQTNETCNDIRSGISLLGLDESQSECAALRSPFNETCCIAHDQVCLLCDFHGFVFDDDLIVDEDTGKTCHDIEREAPTLLAGQKDKCTSLQTSFAESCCADYNTICRLCGNDAFAVDRYTVVDEASGLTCEDVVLEAYAAPLILEDDEQCAAHRAKYYDDCCLLFDEACDLCGPNGLLAHDGSAIANETTRETCDDINYSSLSDVKSDSEQCQALQTAHSTSCCIPDYCLLCRSLVVFVSIENGPVVADAATGQTCHDVEEAALRKYFAGECLDIPESQMELCCPGAVSTSSITLAPNAGPTDPPKPTSSFDIQISWNLGLFGIVICLIFH